VDLSLEPDKYITPTRLWQQDPMMTLDSSASPARIWFDPDGFRVRIYEESGKTFKRILCFTEKRAKAGLDPYMMKNASWADHAERLAADVKRGHLYHYGHQRHAMRYDLKTGKHERQRLPATQPSYFTYRDFCARGYLYTQSLRGVHRHDPDEGMREIPFDYGEKFDEFIGAIKTKDQGVYGNMGLGVNVRGDIAVGSAIVYVPRYEEKSFSESLVDSMGRQDWMGKNARLAWKTGFARRLKKGDLIYHVKPQQGRQLAGTTIWTWDRTGEGREQDAVKGMKRASGAQIDRDGNLYTSFSMRKIAGGRPFLAGRVTVNGKPGESGVDARTGTFVKTTGKGATIFSRSAQMPMDPWPKRAMDVEGGWVEGAEWTYAGVGSVHGRASAHVDWYGRCYVPENYRHSVGILDTNGNLVMHLGKYGNADSGKKVAFAYVTDTATTDEYLAVCDLGNERLVILRINYHAEETAPVK
jgi:hypothetical protein